MKRLLFVTQQLDRDHPVLAATVPKVAALARRVDEVVVLADGAVPGHLPPNARAHRFAASTKVGRGVRFLGALARELRGSAAIVAHMCPIYAVLAAPLARPLGVPVVLWFTHPRASPTLRLAERLATAVTSVDQRSFPLPSGKLSAIGHGIDVTEFACVDPSEGLRLLALGRYGDVKGLDDVVRGVRLAVDRGLDVTLEVRGPSPDRAAAESRRRLAGLVSELGLGERVTLGDGVPRAHVPRLFARSSALVSNTRAGSADKVVFEAAAACLPVLGSSPALAGLLGDLGLTFRGPEELARRLVTLDVTVGRELRRRVEREHSVDSWAEGIVRAAGL